MCEGAAAQVTAPLLPERAEPPAAQVTVPLLTEQAVSLAVQVSVLLLTEQAVSLTDLLDQQLTVSLLLQSHTPLSE